MFRPSHFLLAAALGAFGEVPVCAQEWTGLDEGLNGPVYAVLEYEGLLIAGGAFNAAGSVPVSNIAMWDGTQWSSLGSGMNGEVDALAVYDGELIAAGAFDMAGGAYADHIARWNGSAWTDLAGGLNNVVNSLAVHEGRLIAGGSFVVSDSFDLVRSIAAWDGTTWSALGEGITGPGPNVSALYSFGGDLIAGGIFSTAGVIDAYNIARWDGTTWTTFADGIAGSVSALAVYNNELIAGGHFIAADDVLRWDGDAWQPVSEGLSGFVSTLFVHGNTLFTGGLINTAGGWPASGLASWSGSSTLWTPTAQIGALGTPVIYALCVHDGRLIVAGDMNAVDGVPVDHIAVWDPWTGMAEQVDVPDMVLHPGMPNPFSLATTIVYHLPAAGHAEVIVLDACGRQVETLVDGVQPAGAHAVEFNGTGRAEGTYVVRLTSQGSSMAQRLVFLR